MLNITAVAPTKATGEAPESIEALWDAFKENYDAFKSGEMSLEDEINYTLISAPGPRQYEAFRNFYSLLEDEDEQIWNIWKENKNYVYTHNFRDLKNNYTPAIVELLQNLHSSGYVPSKKEPVTMASGSFWRRHLETRKLIIELLKNLYDKNAKICIYTCAKKEEDSLNELKPFIQRKSRFDIERRIPIHFLLAFPYLFYEFPHTESSTYRLNMLLDLTSLKYKKGIDERHMLRFLHKIIKRSMK